MVGPISDEERAFAYRQLGIGFVLFVGLSAGLTGLWGGATVTEIGVLVLAGLGAGAVVLLALGFGR